MLVYHLILSTVGSIEGQPTIQAGQWSCNAVILLTRTSFHCHYYFGIMRFLSSFCSVCHNEKIVLAEHSKRQLGGN